MTIKGLKGYIKEKKRMKMRKAEDFKRMAKNYMRLKDCY